MADKKNNEVEHTPLKKYKHEGKMLTPPLAELNTVDASWINKRLPDMLWSILVVGTLEREKKL